jgi:hypothetical protein
MTGNRIDPLFMKLTGMARGNFGCNISYFNRCFDMRRDIFP